MVAVRLGSVLVGRDPVGGVVAAGHAPGDLLAGAAEASAQIAGLARAAFDVDRALEGLGRVGGDDIDHAADGLAAPEGGLGAAQHLDARDIADQQVPAVEAALRRGRVVQLDAVDQHHGVLGLRAPDIQAGGLARPAVTREADARLLSQQFDDRDRLAGLDGGLGKDGHRRADGLDRLGGTRRGDDQFGDAVGAGLAGDVGFGRLLLVGHGGAGGEEGRKGG